jgi:hypothetical protein
LPYIIGCGNQSFAQNFAVKAIFGVDSLTKDGICTRFATETVLRRSEKEEIRFHITPGSKQNNREKAKLSSFHLSVSSGSIGDAIEQAKSGQDQPCLTIVNLSGLFLASNSNQSAMAAEKVQEMVLSYIKKPWSIILAVSANNEVVVQQITQRAREFDPTGKRTLGLITKPDKLDCSSDNECTFVELAQNRKV